MKFHGFHEFGRNFIKFLQFSHLGQWEALCLPQPCPAPCGSSWEGGGGGARAARGGGGEGGPALTQGILIPWGGCSTPPLLSPEVGYFV